ncbi:phosphopantetheine-binding protein [Paenibacillus sp. SC116]|uniref:phosphopantetheine-binding protein n=1 Tax=Paenibacillus sp. SC116 TaxID=2968986 RepID=UPI00215B0357|nr:phosphopantetheine-binding protein [Paenibacillus sp. SC116]MCR8843213.1 phosphopantetheine-binding protein [Paenibacillus sp. SC116]
MQISILEQLQQLMVDKLKLQDVPELNPAMHLHDDLGIDSVMLLQLIVHIEEDLSLIVPEDELDPSIFVTVESLVAFINTLEPRTVHVSHS